MTKTAEQTMIAEPYWIRDDREGAKLGIPGFVIRVIAEIRTRKSKGKWMADDADAVLVLADALESAHSSRGEAEKDAIDAKRWRALMASGRIRTLGWAQEGTEHMHMGLELWATYPDRVKGENTDANTTDGARLLTVYADSVPTPDEGTETL